MKRINAIILLAAAAGLPALAFAIDQSAYVSAATILKTQASWDVSPNAWKRRFSA